MISNKYGEVMFAILMGFSMVSIISFANVAIKNGFNEIFFYSWVSSFFIGYPIAIPLILIIPKWIRKLITRITSDFNNESAKGS